MSEKIIQERLRERLTEGREGLYNVLHAIMGAGEAYMLIESALNSLTAPASEDQVERPANYTSIASSLIPANLVDALGRMEEHLRELGANYAANTAGDAASCFHRVYDFIAELPDAKNSLTLLNLRAEAIRRDEREKCARVAEKYGPHWQSVPEAIRARSEGE